MHRRPTLFLILLSSSGIACDPDRPTGPGDADVGALSLAGPPSAMVATATSATRIRIDWLDNASNETGFEVHRSTTGAAGVFTRLTTVAANTVSHTDEGLVTGRAYCYRVRSYRANGKKLDYSAFSNSACATPQPSSSPQSPAAPSGVAAFPIDEYRFRVTWRDNSASELGFRVERSVTGAEPWTPVATLQHDATSLTEDRYGTEQQHCYRVVAYNNEGWGTSEIDCALRPARPTEVAAADSNTFLYISWHDNSSYEDGYEVLRWSGAAFAVIARLPANALAYRDEGAQPDVRYQYRIRATLQEGYSPHSNIVSAFIAASPPAAPGSVAATAMTSEVVLVQWTYVPTTESGFRVERTTDGGASWTTVATLLNTSQPTSADYGRSPETTVCYRVYSRNAAGESPPSPTDCATLMAAPIALVATAEGSDSISLAWRDESAREDGYEIQREFCEWWYGEPSCYYDRVALLPPGSTSWGENGREPGTTYKYQVLAFRREGEQVGYSDAAVATTTIPIGAP